MNSSKDLNSDELDADLGDFLDNVLRLGTENVLDSPEFKGVLGTAVEDKIEGARSASPMLETEVILAAPSVHSLTSTSSASGSLITENENLLKNNRELLEQNKSSLSQCICLQKKVAELEEEKIQLTTEFNNENCELQSQVAKLQMQAEQGEAEKQELNYEMTALKKKLNDANKANKQKQIQLSKDVLMMADDKRAVEEELNMTRQEVEKLHKINKNNQQRLSAIEQEKMQLMEHVAHTERDMENERHKATEMGEQKSETDFKLGKMQQQLHTQREQIQKLTAEIACYKDKEKMLCSANAELENQVVKLGQELNNDSVMTELEAKSRELDARTGEAELLKCECDKLRDELTEERARCQMAKLQLQTNMARQTENDKTLSELLDSKERLVEDSTQAFEDYQQRIASLQKEMADAASHTKEMKGAMVESLREMRELVTAHDPTTTTGLSSSLNGGSDAKRLKRELSLSVGRLRDVVERATRERETLRGEVEDVSCKYAAVVGRYEQSHKLADARALKIKELEEKLGSSKEKLLEIRNEQRKLEVAAEQTSGTVCSMSRDFNKQRDKCESLQKDIETMQQRHKVEVETQNNFLRELYLLLCNVNGEKCQSDKNGINELSSEVRNKLDQFVAIYRLSQQQIYEADEKNCELEKEVECLQAKHKSSIENFAEECRSREEQAVNYRKQLEQHFEAYVKELNNKAESIQAMNDEAFARVKTTESTCTSLKQRCENLKQENAALAQDRRSLSVASYILLSAFHSAQSSRRQLAAQRRQLETVVRSEQAKNLQIRNMVHTLDSEMENEEFELKTTFKSVHPIIRFRAAVIGVIAVRRLVNIHHNPSPSSLMLASSHANMSALLAPSPDVTSSHHEARDYMSRDGLWAEEMGRATRELVTMLHDGNIRFTDKDLRAASEKAFTKIMRWSHPHFQQHQYGCYEDDDLVVKLQRGLMRVTCDKKVSDKVDKLLSKSSACSLRRHFVNFTKRLRQSEVDRLKLHEQNTDLCKSISSRDQKIAGYKDEMGELRVKGESVSRLSRQQCDELTHELSRALDRETTSQQLLHEQNGKIKELKQRLKKASSEGSKNAKQLNAAVDELTEARLEVKRRSQQVKELEVRMENACREKKQLEDTVEQAKEALKKAAGEKSRISAYFSNVEKTFQKAQATKNLAGELNDMVARNQYEQNHGLKAATRTVDRFIQAQSDAVQRINHLETQLSSYRKHINTLKKEFQDCQIGESNCTSMIPTREVKSSELFNICDDEDDDDDQFTALQADLSVASSSTNFSCKPFVRKRSQPKHP